MVCNFTLDKEGYTIFYLNIFQKLIEYFRDGKNSFYVYTQSGIKNLDSKYELRLDVCFKIHQILCLLLFERATTRAKLVLPQPAGP